MEPVERPNGLSLSLQMTLARVVGEQRTEKLINLWSRFWKYATGSAISAIFSQLVLLLTYSILRLESPRGAAITATLAGAVPSYFLNRNWAWGRSGRSSLHKEVLPYFAMAIAGLIFSTWAVDWAHSNVTVFGTSRLVQDIVVQGSYLGSFVILWFGKFAVMHRWLFNAPTAPDRTGSTQ